MASQARLKFVDDDGLQSVLDLHPYYEVSGGRALLGDSLQVMRCIPDATISLVLTSPPYALHFKKEYGNKDKHEYIQWMLPFAREIQRILKEDGSFVLNIGGSYNKGVPTRSIYHLKLVVALVEELGFHLAQECFWYNPAKMPMPAEWVTVRRVRVRDSVEYVWWLSKSAHPKADNSKVLRAYSKDMLRLNQRGQRHTTRPGGHIVKSSFAELGNGGSIPPNVIELDAPDDLLRFGNNSANDRYTIKCKEAGFKIHPARFPAAIPDFFIRLLTDRDDIVLDPFAGSNTLGMVANKLGRRWIAIEQEEQYLRASRFRFEELDE